MKRFVRGFDVADDRPNRNRAVSAVDQGRTSLRIKDIRPCVFQLRFVLAQALYGRNRVGHPRGCECRIARGLSPQYRCKSYDGAETRRRF
jgi:hypothetical protein